VGGFLPPLAIIALPIIFAAGMSLMDSLDGIFMVKAYSWAFTSPLRKIFYNLTTTTLSIFVALVIGTIELVSVLAGHTSIGKYEPFKTIANIDLGSLGYFIVGSFVGAWALSVIIWRTGKYEAKYSSGISETEHTHRELHID
jgi:high-affinity nickel-transport protein